MSRALASLLLLASTVGGALLLWDAALEREIERAGIDLADADQAVRRRARERLTALGSPAVLRLIDSFGQARSSVRAVSDEPSERRLGDNPGRVMEWLSSMPRDELMPPLTRALSSDNGSLRHHASTVLAFLGTDVLPVLVEGLRESPDPRVRSASAWSLSLMGPEAIAARPALQAALGDEHKDVRHSARYALAQLESQAQGTRTMLQKLRTRISRQDD